MRIRRTLARLLVVPAALALASCHPRPSPPAVQPDRAGSATTARPTLRIYYLVDLDGYLEPCGCQLHPLGGIDRLAHYIHQEAPSSPPSLFVASGNLLYRDVRIDEHARFQEDAKAESVAHILDDLGLAAYAPGPSDFARGPEQWRHALSLGHTTALIANSQGFPGSIVRDVGGVRVGIVGVSDFRESVDEEPVAGAPVTTDPLAAVRAAVADVRAHGARVVVVLGSVPRRVARSIAQGVPGVSFVIAAREPSLTPPPPEPVGAAFVVTATDQGKSLGVLDITLREDGRAMVDTSAATAGAEVADLDRRMAELRTRLDGWSHDPHADVRAIETQRARLDQLVQQRSGLGRARTAPADRSSFAAHTEVIVDTMPREAPIERRITAYFHEVNEHNRVAYADLHSPAVPAGRAGYVGAEACRECHEDAYQVWIRTSHSSAYHTLEAVSKNFNLSCVGCHVTGYQQPGGAEVVQNEGLRDVQCESCHGPGSLHVAARTDTARRASIRNTFDASFCAGACHTQEHSDQFDFDTYRPRVLGPGHGFPAGSDAGVTLSQPVVANGARGDAPAHALPH